MPNYEAKVKIRIVTFETSTFRMEADNMCAAEAEAIARANADRDGMDTLSVVTQLIMLEDDAVVFDRSEDSEPEEAANEGEYVPYSARKTLTVESEEKCCGDNGCPVECDDTPAEEPASEYVPYSARKAATTAVVNDDDDFPIDDLTDEELSVGQVTFPSAADDAEDAEGYVTYRQRFGTVNGYVPCSQLDSLTVSDEPAVIDNGEGGYTPYSQRKVKTEE